MTCACRKFVLWFSLVGMVMTIMRHVFFVVCFAKITRHHDPRIDSELKCHCLRYLGHRVNMFHDHIEVHYWLHKLTFIE